MMILSHNFVIKIEKRIALFANKQLILKRANSDPDIPKLRQISHLSTLATNLERQETPSLSSNHEPSDATAHFAARSKAKRTANELHAGLHRAAEARAIRLEATAATTPSSGASPVKSSDDFKPDARIESAATVG